MAARPKLEPSINPRDEEPETPESIAATRKVMALISISLVLVIDVASYTFARQKPGVFAMIALPMAVVTLVVFGFAWRMLKLATTPDDSAPK